MKINIGKIYRLKHVSSTDSHFFNNQHVRVIAKEGTRVIATPKRYWRNIYVYENELIDVNYIAFEPINKPEFFSD